MNAQMERLALVDGWLDKVLRLPPGHPDRLRFLTYAEQILEGSAGQRLDLDAGGAAVLSGSEPQASITQRTLLEA